MRLRGLNRRSFVLLTLATVPFAGDCAGAIRADRPAGDERTLTALLEALLPQELLLAAPYPARCLEWVRQSAWHAEYLADLRRLADLSFADRPLAERTELLTGILEEAYAGRTLVFDFTTISQWANLRGGEMAETRFPHLAVAVLMVVLSSFEAHDTAVGRQVRRLTCRGLSGLQTAPTPLGAP